jgi:hypothetical protein
MTISNEQLERTSATWYAWGRNDAEGTATHVFDFADFYVAQRTSRGQSVQDAYKTFVADVAPTTATKVAQAKVWQAERQRIMDVEAETGVLDHDAIHASDDDAVEFADWVAGGLR